MKDVKTHRDLIVWQKSLALANSIYVITRDFPIRERFGLAQQMRRAAVSVPSNIAEGSARRHRGEYLQFLHIARGSLAELETQLLIARRQSFLHDDLVLAADLQEVGRLLNGLIRAISNAD